MSYTIRREMTPVHIMGQSSVQEYMPSEVIIEARSTDVQSALEELSAGLNWRQRPQVGDTMMIDQNGEEVPAVYNVQNGTGRFVPIGIDQVQVYRDGILQHHANDYVETTVSDHVTLSGMSLNTAGLSTIATNSQIEELKDEIQFLKDEIENLKMLLLEN